MPELLHTLHHQIRRIILDARAKVATAVNFAQVEAQWRIGLLIVEQEQQGEARASYGKALIKSLSVQLSEEFGKYYSERNLFYMKQFYLAFPKVNALRSELSWPHYRSLLRVENEQARQFYLTEAIAQNCTHYPLKHFPQKRLYAA